MSGVQVEAFLQAAESRVGLPYVWGAAGPSAFDCSGLVQWSLARAGIVMPRVAADQARTGPLIPVSDLRPGDLLFYHTDVTAPTYISHVAIYLGNGLMEQAPEPGMDVQVVNADFGPAFAGAVQISPAVAAAVAGDPAWLTPGPRPPAPGPRDPGPAPSPFRPELTAAVCLAVSDLACNHHYMTTDEQGGAQGGSAAEKLRGWFGGRMPGDWFTEPPEIKVDREEITVLGALDGPPSAEGASAAELAAAAEGRSRRFREETRQLRVEIAREAEHRFGRKVSWGVTCGGHKVMFTTFSVPVMTRLRQSERLVLDTLVDAGVARSRSDALAWCVRLVGQHQDAWLADLRSALQKVEQVRAEGPAS